MAHIVEFAITGLAGRDNEYAQKLNRDLNIFYGLNGRGKTSLLRILDSAMSEDASLLKDVPFRKAEVKIYSIKYKMVYTYKIEQPEKLPAKEPESSRELWEAAIGASVAASVPAERITSWHVTPKSIGGRFQHRYLPTSRLYLGDPSMPQMWRTPGERSLSEEKLDILFADFIGRLWSIYSNALLSDVRKAQEFGLAEILRDILAGKKPKKKHNELDPEIVYEHASRFLGRQNSSEILGSPSDFKQRYKKNATMRTIVGRLNEIESRIETIMGPRNQLQALIQEMFSGGKTVTFGDSQIEIMGKHKAKIGLSSLSSGEKHALRILIETLLVQESTLLIDEPEISLHVDWQKRLINTMRQLNPQSQLILATHSPEIMADVDDSKIFTL